MDKSVEIFKELVNKLKDQNDSEKELFKELSEVIEKYENKCENESKPKLSDEELLSKYAKSNFESINNDIKFRLKPFDVLNGVYYNEETEKFELYPFRVINKENRKIELLGLKLLGYGNWDSVKDMKFRFMFFLLDGIYGLYPEVVHGEIPDKDRLVEIRNNYPNRGLFDKDNYDLIAIGSWYWTRTEHEGSGSDAWGVNSGGYVDTSCTSNSFGALPYVAITLNYLL